MSGNYQIFQWFDCLWMLLLCLPVYSTRYVYFRWVTVSFREVVRWLKVFFVISDNTCANYLFQRNNIFFEILLLVVFSIFLYNLGWYLVYASVCRLFPSDMATPDALYLIMRCMIFLENVFCLINLIFPDNLIFQLGFWWIFCRIFCRKISLSVIVNFLHILEMSNRYVLFWGPDYKECFFKELRCLGFACK